MSKDHLSNETGLTVAVTETGLALKAKSRAISAVDRFFGGLFDHFNPDIERPAQVKRAKAARQDRIDEAVTSKMLEAIHADPEIGQRALEQHLGAIGRRHDNKAAVVTLALQDLRDNPPTEEQSAEGSPELDADFSNRLERYAEDATSVQLRERWARVLASEIRAPGTFSTKVMRIVDELDAETAKVFEDLCINRIGNVVPRATAGELKFNDAKRLTTAGLILETSLGQVRVGSRVPPEGDGHYLFGFGDLVAVFPTVVELDKLARNDSIFQLRSGKPQLPVYVLTDAGEAVASILPNDELSALDRLLTVASARYAPAPFTRITRGKAQTSGNKVFQFSSQQAG